MGWQLMAFVHRLSWMHEGKQLPQQLNLMLQLRSLQVLSPAVLLGALMCMLCWLVCALCCLVHWCACCTVWCALCCLVHWCACCAVWCVRCAALLDARNDCAHVSDLQVLELQTKHLTISLAANDTLFASFLVCECRKEQMSPLPLGGIPERLSC